MLTKRPTDAVKTTVARPRYLFKEENNGTTPYSSEPKSLTNLEVIQNETRLTTNTLTKLASTLYKAFSTNLLALDINEAYV